MYNNNIFISAEADEYGCCCTILKKVLHRFETLFLASIYLQQQQQQQ